MHYLITLAGILLAVMLALNLTAAIQKYPSYFVRGILIIVCFVVIAISILIPEVHDYRDSLLSFAAVFLGIAIPMHIEKSLKRRSAAVALSMIRIELDHNVHHLEQILSLVKEPAIINISDLVFLDSLSKRLVAIKEGFASSAFVNRAFTAWLSGDLVQNTFIRNADESSRCVNAVQLAYAKIDQVRSSLNANVTGTVLIAQSIKQFSSTEPVSLEYVQVAGRNIQANREEIIRVLKAALIISRQAQPILEQAMSWYGIKYYSTSDSNPV